MLVGKKRGLPMLNAMNKMIKPSFVIVVAVSGAAVMCLVLFASRCNNSSSGE